MPSYILLALVVIVIIAIGVVGILLIRRGRRVADEDLFMTEPAGGDWAADQAAGAQAHEATLSGSPLAGDHPEPETSLNAESDGDCWASAPCCIEYTERLDAHAVVEPLHAGPASQTQSLAMAETPVAVSELKTGT